MVLTILRKNIFENFTSVSFIRKDICKKSTSGSSMRKKSASGRSLNNIPRPAGLWKKFRWSLEKYFYKTLSSRWKMWLVFGKIYFWKDMRLAALWNKLKNSFDYSIIFFLNPCLAGLQKYFFYKSQSWTFMKKMI